MIHPVGAIGIKCDGCGTSVSLAKSQKKISHPHPSFNNTILNKKIK